MKRLDSSRLGAVAWLAVGLATVACTDNLIVDDAGGSGTGESSGTTDPVVTTTMDTTTGVDPDDTAMPPDPDLPGVDTDGTVSCDGAPCPVDLLFVIDNSGTMGEEQLALANGFGDLVNELQNVHNALGEPVELDVNIMVTTTDMGHPACTAFQPPDYEPRAGAPVYTGCNSRIQRFNGLDPTDPVSVPEACTNNCPVDIAPDGHFINFGPDGSNVPNDDVGAALACIGPQGIDGCGFESPLETMLQAINESACWNAPEQEACDADPEWADATEGFLRDGSLVAVVIATDELDCSVAAPGGYSHFNEPDNWNVNPDVGIPQLTSAICFNAGVSCTDANGDDLYEECVSVDTGALHPVARYTDYLDYLAASGHHVMMIGLLGVPPVVEHAPEAPFEPVTGGVADLLYRNWFDGSFPGGDIPPDEWGEGVTAAHKIFQYGDLGPGCTGLDPSGTITSQALPPIRVREVCEGLDSVDDEGNVDVRCCIESICDDDFSAAYRCITGGILVGPQSLG